MRVEASHAATKTFIGFDKCIHAFCDCRKVQSKAITNIHKVVLLMRLCRITTSNSSTNMTRVITDMTHLTKPGVQVPNGTGDSIQHRALRGGQRCVGRAFCSLCHNVRHKIRNGGLAGRHSRHLSHQSLHHTSTTSANEAKHRTAISFPSFTPKGIISIPSVFLPHVSTYTASICCLVFLS